MRLANSKEKNMDSGTDSDSRKPELASDSSESLSPTQGQCAWLPIETAPKDGREVILVVESRAGIRQGMLVGHYMEGGFCIEDHPAIDEGWYFWSGSMFDKASKPTHWMPLPDPPTEVKP